MRHHLANVTSALDATHRDDYVPTHPIPTGYSHMADEELGA